MNKYVAPIFSALAASLFIFLFGFFYFLVFKQIPGLGYIGFIFVAVAAIALGLLAAVLLKRIKEIKKGEDDDLGEY